MKNLKNNKHHKELFESTYHHIHNGGVTIRTLGNVSRKLENNDVVDTVRHELSIRQSSHGVYTETTLSIDNGQFCRELAAQLLRFADKIDHDPTYQYLSGFNDLRIDYRHSIKRADKYDMVLLIFRNDIGAEQFIEWLENNTNGAWFIHEIGIESEKYRSESGYKIAFEDSDDAIQFRLAHDLDIYEGDDYEKSY